MSSKPCAIERIRSMAASNGRALRQTVADVRRQLDEIFAKNVPGPFERAYILGCGTSYYGAVVMKHAFETLAGIPAEGAQGFAFTAYQNPKFLGPKTLVVAFSSAGTTTALCDAFTKCGKTGAYRVAVTAIADSPMAHTAEATLLTGATDETTVMRTKAQVHALVTMYLLAIELGARNGTLAHAAADDYIAQMDRAIDAIVDIVANKEQTMKGLAVQYKDCVAADVLGSGPMTGTAQCGALMVTEMAKVHAWGDEMENYLHGRDRLIPKPNPLFILAPEGAASARLLDVLTVTAHMKCPTVVLTDKPTEPMRRMATHIIEVKGGFSEIIAPIAYLAPMYLFANHLAEAKGDDPNTRLFMDILPAKAKYKG